MLIHQQTAFPRLFNFFVYQTAQRLKEHHGLDMSLTTLRRITVVIAKLARQVNQLLPPTLQNRQERTLVEFDGGMVPLVMAEGYLDRRKAKKCLWAELRVGATQKIGSIDWKYESFFSSVDDVGDQMRMLLERQMGWTQESTLYGIGDGAKWIVAKMGLPIGSGKIESTNKHLIQKRLKLPGAWWKKRKCGKHGGAPCFACQWWMGVFVARRFFLFSQKTRCIESTTLNYTRGRLIFFRSMLAATEDISSSLQSRRYG